MLIIAMRKPSYRNQPSKKKPAAAEAEAGLEERSVPTNSARRGQSNQCVAFGAGVFVVFVVSVVVCDGVVLVTSVRALSLRVLSFIVSVRALLFIWLLFIWPLPSKWNFWPLTFAPAINPPF